MDIEVILGFLLLAWLGIGLVIFYGMFMAGWNHFIPFILLKMIGISFIYCLYLYFSEKSLEDNYFYIRPLRNYILSYAIVSSLLIAIAVFTEVVSPTI